MAMPQVEAHLQLWRAQLALIARQAEEQAARLEVEAARAEDTAAQARLRALAQAVRQQRDDVTVAYADLNAVVDARDPLELP
ncbi:MAG TPA: hypothetical protein VGG33_18760, partial [Polyangia bacterium]